MIDIDHSLIHSKIFSLSLYTVVHTVSWGNKRVLAGVVNLALLVQKEIRGLPWCTSDLIIRSSLMFPFPTQKCDSLTNGTHTFPRASILDVFYSFQPGLTLWVVQACSPCPVHSFKRGRRQDWITSFCASFLAR